jgi:hypothetical protein
MKGVASRFSELGRAMLLQMPVTARCVRRHDRARRCDIDDSVLVSLTTIPDRVTRLRPALRSVLDQTRRPDAIVLNLPRRSRREGREYEIPSYLSQMPVEIDRCERDWGPATKYLPTLLREVPPDTRIIVVDDDQIYPSNLIETLVAWSERLPDAAVCARGYRVPPDMDHSRRTTRFGTRIGQPEAVEVMQGASGFLIRKRFAVEGLFDYDAAPPEAFFNDDIWLGGHLAKAGIERFVVPFENRYARVEPRTARGTLSLHLGENMDNRNNETLYRFFSEYWKWYD